MSLKGVHIIFIIASILLLIGFGYWSLNNYFKTHCPFCLVMGPVCFLAAAGLGVYVIRFSKKVK